MALLEELRSGMEQRNDASIHHRPGENHGANTRQMVRCIRSSFIMLMAEFTRFDNIRSVLQVFPADIAAGAVKK